MSRKRWGQVSNLVRENWGLLLSALIGLVAYGGLVRLDRVYGGLRGAATAEAIAWYLLAFTGFITALLWAEQRGVSLKVVWGAAVLFRITLLFTSPTLSDDVYRYLWDGYIANQGISPYAYAIDAIELDPYDHPIRGAANNPWMASPYLPAAQWVFALSARFFPLRIFPLQILMVGFDLLTGVVIAGLLRMAGLPARRLILYLWNPLVVVEAAHGAHIDAWMVLLSLAAVWFTFRFSEEISSKTRWWLSLVAPVLLSLATLTKILPILLLPVLFFRWSWKQRGVYGAGVAAVLVPAGLRGGWGLVGSLTGTGVFGALRIYADQWTFNSGVFYWSEAWLRETLVFEPTRAAKAVVLVVLAGILLVVMVFGKRRPGIRGALRLAAIPWMGYLLLTPTLHPWYALALLAFLPFLPPREDEPRALWLAVLPWLYLSAVLVFSYLTYRDPFEFLELEWVRQLEWLPTFALLAIGAAAAARRLGK